MIITLITSSKSSLMSRIASSTAARAAALSAEVIDEGSVSVAVLVIAWIKTEKKSQKTWHENPQVYI